MTADNNVDPAIYCRWTLRSADHEVGVTLNARHTNKKTTITLPKKYLQRAQLSRWREATINILNLETKEFNNGK